VGYGLVKLFAMTKKNRLLLFLLGILILIDQITKVIVDRTFAYGESVEVISGFFNLTYVRNKGAAFGMLADLDNWIRVPLFILIPIVALFVIGQIFKKLPPDDILVSFALTCVLSGAIGNLIDRVRLGYVIDFFDFHWNDVYHFAVFNVADAAISCGVAFLLIDIFVGKNKLNSKEKPDFEKVF